MIISSFLFMLALVSFGFFISTYCRIKAKYTPLVSVTTFICIGVLAGIFNVLSLASGVIYVVTFIVGGVTIYKKKKEFCNYILQLPTICFIASWLVTMILFSIKSPFFISWDEFSHWGPFLKNIKYTNELHVYAERYFVHQTYVQGMPILYYISSYFDGVYREESVYLAYSILLHSCAVTVLPSISVNKKWKTSFVYILLTPFFWYLFPYAYYAAPYTCSYLDVVLGALFGGIMTFIIGNLHQDMWDKKKVWCFAVLLFSLLQIKDISIAFYLVCFATCTINLIYLLYRKNIDFGMKKTRIVLMHILYTIVIPLLGKVMWGIVLGQTGKNVDQFSESTLNKALDLFISYVRGGNDYFGQVFNAFWTGIESVNISWTHTIIPVIVFGILVISIVIGYKHSQSGENKVVGVHLGLLVFYFLCYLAVLFVIYLCGMSTEEALTNASMDRYVACFVAGWAMLLFGLLLEIVYEYKESVAVRLASLAIIFIYVTIPLNNVYYWNTTKEHTGLAWYENKSQACMEVMENESDVWLVISEHEDWHRKYIFSYTLMPNVLNLNLPVDDTKYTAAEVLSLAEDNEIDYFLVIDSNQKFKEKYAEYIAVQNDKEDQRCMLMRLTDAGMLEQVY